MYPDNPDVSSIIIMNVKTYGSSSGHLLGNHWFVKTGNIISLYYEINLKECEYGRQ